jgi:anion-transporting  ArsA/GET3 family ATPase
VKHLLNKGATLVMLGTGGVGKTTIAAALALAAAEAGLDTGVITVDPARRLRDALGLERLSARPTRLDARRLRRAGLASDLRLSAMVLDVKGAWDGLIERFVKSPETRRRVLENSFYRSLTEQFAGAEAYAALEQLYDLHASGRFDLEVVDTPPAAHAFEFLEAPAHIVRLLDSQGVRWLVAPSAAADRGLLGLASRAARFVAGQLERFAGAGALAAIGEFFAALAGAAGSIGDQFRKVEGMLHEPATNFVLVTTPEADRLIEARALVERMAREGFRLRAVVINRFLDERTYRALAEAPRREPPHLRKIAKLRAALGPEGAGNGRVAELAAYLEDYRADQRAIIERASAFARTLPARVELTLAPELEAGVRDLGGLGRIAAILAESGSGRRFLADAMIATADGGAPGRKRFAGSGARRA